MNLFNGDFIEIKTQEDYNKLIEEYSYVDRVDGNWNQLPGQYYYVTDNKKIICRCGGCYETILYICNINKYLILLSNESKRVFEKYDSKINETLKLATSSLGSDA